MSIASCGTSRKLKARESCLSRDPSIERLRANRLLKKTHMLRCRSIASLQRTVSTPPLVDFSRASHLDLFEQPARGFFQHPAGRPILHYEKASAVMLYFLVVIAQCRGIESLA